VDEEEEATWLQSCECSRYLRTLHTIHHPIPRHLSSCWHKVTAHRIIPNAHSRCRQHKRGKRKRNQVFTSKSASYLSMLHIPLNSKPHS